MLNSLPALVVERAKKLIFIASLNVSGVCKCWWEVAGAPLEIL